MGEAVGLQFGPPKFPADALVFPPLAAPGEDPGLPTAIDFLITGAFNTTNRSGLAAARNAAASPDAIMGAGELKKAGEYRRKVRNAWKLAVSSVSCPGSGRAVPWPPGGLAEGTGFRFRAAVFDTFGGCCGDTTEVLMSYANRVADRQGTTTKRVFDRVNGRLRYSI